MSDILEKIQALQEQFSNLFEVDDLGQPAMDVPPSQNKIKKDRKTKDGKAELVSVEDELFPYDGNKKEQYRQKIIDTINNMIQGKATLEDLLQIVRQKKAPLKEAMELMENLINKRDQYHISKKSVADAEAEFKDSPLRHAQSLERMRFGYDNGKDDRKDVAKYRIGMHDGAKSPAHAYKSEYRYDDDSTPCDRAEETKNRIKRAHVADTLKEAMELMEDLFSTILKQPDEKQGSLVYKYHQAKNKENAGKDTYTQAKEEEKRKSKEEKGQEKTEQRKKYRGKSVEDWKLGRLMDQIARNAKNLGKVEDSATAKAIRRNAQKAALKEALSLMEAIEKYIDNDGNTHELEFSANKNKYKFDHKINGKSVVSAVDSEPNANYERKHAVKNYALKKVEEALEIMEAIINEFNDDVKVKVGKIRADKAMDSMKQLRNNSIALRKAQNSEEREKIANEMSKNSDELDVNYKKAKKFTNLFNRNVKDNNKKQELKNYITARGAADDKEYQEKASEALEEALSILIEGRKEGESQEDFKHRLHGELVRAIDDKATQAKKEAIEGKKGAYEKYKKEHDKLGKLDDIEPVANAYIGVEQENAPDIKKAEMQVHKADRRNAEKMAKQHGYSAKKYENRAIKAGDAGKERKAEYLEDKANDEWDKETAQQQRAANAHRKVEKLRYGEALEEAINILSELTEADHHANKKNPVVKITDKNYRAASGKSLPGPFNKNHVGQYIVYNKDTDASYLVTPDNWKKSKIKKDLESQGKFYEAFEETMKLIELFDRPDLLDDIDTTLGSPVKKILKKILNPKKEKSCKK